MKKIVGIILSLISTLPATAYENLIITAPDTIARIKNLSPEIINVSTLTTIMNERNTLIVDILKEGNAEFSTILETGKECNFKLSITKNKTEIKNSPKNFEIFIIDDYAKDMELDLPVGVKFK